MQPLFDEVKKIAGARYAIAVVGGNATLAFVGILFLDGAPGQLLASANLVLVVVMVLGIINAVRDERRLSAAETSIAATAPVSIAVVGLDRWKTIFDPDHPHSVPELELVIAPEEHGKQAPFVSSASLTYDGKQSTLQGQTLADGSIVFTHIHTEAFSNPALRLDIKVGGR